MKETEPAVVVGKAYDLTLWVLRKVEKFPRAHRFTVGDRLVQETLDLLLLLAFVAKVRSLLQHRLPFGVLWGTQDRIHLAG